MVNFIYSFLQLYSRKVVKIKNFNYALLLSVSFIIIYAVIFFWPEPAYEFKNGQLTVNSLLTEHEYNKSLTIILNNENICEKNNTLLSIIIINSSTKNIENRISIRDTWSQWIDKNNSRLIFLLSNPENDFLQRQIELENYYYDDIIQYNTTDNYYLLTFKTLSNLHWTYNYCSNVKYLIKCDDDVFVNWPKLSNFLNDNLSLNQTIFGNVRFNTKPLRQTFSRWHMPYSEYQRNFYPSFANGPFYIMTYDVVPSLLNASKNIKPIYLEDVYFTGILREHLKNIKIVDVKNFIVTYYFSFLTCSSNYIYTFHKVKTNQMKYLYETLNSQSSLNFLKSSCRWILNKTGFVS